MTDGFHLVVDALKLERSRHDLRRRPASRSPILCAWRRTMGHSATSAFEHEQSAGNAAAIAGYLTQKPGICMTVVAPGFLNGWSPWLMPRTQLFPDDHDQRVERPTARSSISNRAITEEMDQLAPPRPMQGGLPHQPPAGYRASHAARDDRAVRGVGAAGRRLSRLDRLEVLGAPRSTRRPRRSRWSRSSIPAPPNTLTGAGNRRPRRDDLLAAAQARRIAIPRGKGAAYARAGRKSARLIGNDRHSPVPADVRMAKGLLPDDPSRKSAAAAAPMRSARPMW